MLKFVQDKENYKIFNDKEDFLGEVRKHRVGAYLHWCFFPDEAPLGDLWFSAGCMDEIRKFMKNPDKFEGHKIVLAKNKCPGCKEFMLFDTEAQQEYCNECGVWYNV